MLRLLRIGMFSLLGFHARPCLYLISGSVQPRCCLRMHLPRMGPHREKIQTTAHGKNTTVERIATRPPLFPRSEPTLYGWGCRGGDGAIEANILQITCSYSRGGTVSFRATDLVPPFGPMPQLWGHPLSSGVPSRPKVCSPCTDFVNPTLALWLTGGAPPRLGLPLAG